MTNQLLINVQHDERRLALIEGGVTAELFYERVGHRGPVGNIYKGRVVRVLPGMQAAFVEIGLARAAFLFVGDAVPPESRAPSLAPPAPDDADEDGATLPSDAPAAPRRRSADHYPSIETILRQGDELLVQVTKEPMGTKGARITTHVTLPGRHVVFVPGDRRVAISRRIQDPDERERLRALGARVCPSDGGVILRTASVGVSEEDAREDLSFLTALWGDIQRRAAGADAPALIHADLDATLRSVRDLAVDRVLVDDAGEATRIRRFIQGFVPDFRGTVEVWEGPDPLFERFGLEWEIARAMRRKIWLRSGGSIVIDRTEALTAIDVNTGRFVGKSSFEETVLEINLEAVREIAYQLRLRNIGGLIVIDFIDMNSESHRERVHAALTEALAGDKARTHVLPMSALGLIEMTRKRVRDSNVQSLTEPCFYCDGTGYLRSVRLIIDGVLSGLEQRLSAGAAGVLHVTAHPNVTSPLVEEHGDALARLESKYQVEIQVTPDADLHVETFRID